MGLIGIDAPEEVKPDYPVECGARQAAALTRERVEEEPATLVTDPTQNRFDRYGRLLAYVYVGGESVNRLEIREGWAYTYVYQGHRFQQFNSFVRAQKAAQRKVAGAWAKCHGDFHSGKPGRQK